MAIKKYHVSKNLFDENWLSNNTGINADGIPYPYNNRVASYTPIILTGNSVTLSFSGSVNAIYSLFDSNDTLLTRVANISSGTIIDTTGATKMYLCFYKSNGATTTDDVSNVMVNKGSTAIPFEPYYTPYFEEIGYKKYESATDTITSLPADAIADGQSASADIIGNMVQTGTPSPQSIIIPSETGDKTANLFDYQTMASGGSGYLKSDGTIAAGSSWAYTDYIPCDGTHFVLSKVGGGSAAICFYDSTKTYIYGQAYQTGGASTLADIICTVPQTAKYIRFTYNIEGATAIDLSTIMLSENTSAVSYQPYGYKIPILSGGTTTNVYLGEVQSTRQIKQLVITGQETGWRIHQSLQSWFQLILSDSVVSGFELCTHYKPSPNAPATIQNGEILVNFDGANNRAIIRDTTYTTLDDFKTYLQQQYANGTPVTVWYVLATPTTGIVNEPIRKIGDYSDSVSATNLPTTGTAEQFDIDTTLKPSEVQLTYHGWHEHQDTKYTT